ncbi:MULTISPECIES: hypothetical protein [Psychrilyobacter]|uniref:hypothetical protein n=1 Tax=Psychrilyobacter TaxID=623282 RepID=UPI0011C05F0A|nr:MULTISPECIES: hypothetical protein [Psychrilyobacter]MCS5423192.1 hypothetical protein [Psychrilyobacter sp. S5]
MSLGLEEFKQKKKGIIFKINPWKYKTNIFEIKINRKGEQVTVHSSHRYHKSILKDIIQVIASIDRDLIEGREPVIFNEKK